MPLREFEQNADDLILHETQPLGAQPAAAVTQQHALYDRASTREGSLELLSDGGAQLALVAAVQRLQLLELGRDRGRVEDLGEACRSRGGDRRGHVEHGFSISGAGASCHGEAARFSPYGGGKGNRQTTLAS
jgi:hypothetical protein